jgi:hypothetical protein
MTAQQAVTFDNYRSLLPVPTSPQLLVCSSQEKGRGILKSCGPRQKKGDGDGQRAKVLLAVAIFLVALAARDHANDDLDDYKFRIDRSWWSSVTVGQTQSWGDPVLGARFRPNLNKGSFVSLKGDAGGFGAGSQLTWQVYTGVGKQSKDIYSLLLGYRYMDVD